MIYLFSSVFRKRFTLNFKVDAVAQCYLGETGRLVVVLDCMIVYMSSILFFIFVNVNVSPLVNSYSSL